jgi:tRNA(fMet)-specific endonuclease VapC
MRFVLDTDHISILQRETGPEFDRLAARAAQYDPGELAFSIISFHEQVLGCHTYISRARAPADLVRGYEMLGRVIRDFTAAPVLLLDAVAVTTFAELRAQRLRVKTMDLRIAAIALARGLVLLIRNIRDFGRIPGLRIEDWTV